MSWRCDQINVRLAHDDREYLRQRAAAEQRSVSGQIRWWIQRDRERNETRTVTMEATK